MKALIRACTSGLAGLAAWSFVGAVSLPAQNRPPQDNVDPAQMRQRMSDRVREQFEVQDDSEWHVISERIRKVTEARRAIGGTGGPGGPGGFGPPGSTGGRGGPGGPPGQGGGRGADRAGPSGNESQRASGRPQGGPERAGNFGGGPNGPGGPAGFNRESNPDLDALRKAIANHASIEEIKAKLVQLRTARKQKEAELEKAQEELRQILSVRQEAIAITLGLLK